MFAALTFFDADVRGSIGCQDLDTRTSDTVGNDLAADLVALDLEVVANLQRCHRQRIRSVERCRASRTIRRRALWVIIGTGDTHREATECY